MMTLAVIMGFAVSTPVWMIFVPWAFDAAARRKTARLTISHQDVFGK
jgi:hypothetical protein